VTSQRPSLHDRASIATKSSAIVFLSRLTHGAHSLFPFSLSGGPDHHPFLSIDCPHTISPRAILTLAPSFLIQLRPTIAFSLPCFPPAPHPCFSCYWAFYALLAHHPVPACLLTTVAPHLPSSSVFLSPQSNFGIAEPCPSSC
jgi:hypothetical protein